MREQPNRRPARRRRKQQNKALIWIAAAAAVVLIGLLCLLLIPGEPELPKAHDPARGPLRALTVGSYTRQGESMVVDTSYIAVQYPYAFSDLISIEAIDQGNQKALEFSAKIAGQSRRLYTLWFNGKDGEVIGAYDLNDGEKPVVVTMAFYTPDAQLQGDDRITYFATQETVNDVLTAMKKDKNFTPYQGV